jgi:hypothetical protein
MDKAKLRFLSKLFMDVALNKKAQMLRGSYACKSRAFNDGSYHFRQHFLQFTAGDFTSADFSCFIICRPLSVL